MLNILTYVLIALAAISAASFQIMTMFNNNSMLINSQSEQLSLGKIVANIEDSMTSDPISGDYRVLLGENPSFDNDSDGLNDIAYHTIPSGLGIPKINAWENTTSTALSGMKLAEEVCQPTKSILALKKATTLTIQRKHFHLMIRSL